MGLKGFSFGPFFKKRNIDFYSCFFKFFSKEEFLSKFHLFGAIFVKFHILEDFWGIFGGETVLFPIIDSATVLSQSSFFSTSQESSIAGLEGNLVRFWDLKKYNSYS